MAVCKVMTFLAVRPRLSTALATFILFHSGVTPLEGVTRDGLPPRFPW